jgi:alginate O-acetyltransferase complex protein AlgJ
MSSDVLVGREGWLFLYGGSNKVGDIYCGRLPDNGWLDGWYNLLESRSRNFRNKGIDFLHVSAPEKISIYSQYANYLEEDFSVGNSPASLLSERCFGLDCYVDPSPFLRSQSESYQVYQKTDTHWSFYGAYSVYQLLMYKLGLKIEDAILHNIPEPIETVMDLGSKQIPALKENIIFYRPRSVVVRSYANELVKYKEINALEGEAGLHVGSSVEYRNPTAKYDKRVIIFGDSFSEYRPSLLTGFFAESFSVVRFVWNLSLDYNLIESFLPDVVISESAERFMPFYVPNDELNLTDFVSERILEYKGD